MHRTRRQPRLAIVAGGAAGALARLQAGVLMRAVEGFGIEHQLRADRFLTLSEDLPLAAVAVDKTEPGW